MTRFAEKTSVTPEASRAEIERTLSRYGADQFLYGWEGEFLAQIVLPNGETVGQWAAPQIEVAYAKGEMPNLIAWEGGAR